MIANNPLRLGGCLDSPSAEKAARFVRMCDAFGVPLLVHRRRARATFPASAQEWDGVVRRGAKLLHAFGEAVVPRVTLVTRKSYGGAYIAMNARALGATRVFAWPGAEMAVMGPVAAVRILHRRKIAAVAADLRPQVEAELATEHEEIAGGVEKAVEIGVVDEVVEPAATRSALARALATALGGADEPGHTRIRGHHGNIPSSLPLLPVEPSPSLPVEPSPSSGRAVRFLRSSRHLVPVEPPGCCGSRRTASWACLVPR